MAIEREIVPHPDPPFYLVVVVKDEGDTTHELHFIETNEEWSKFCIEGVTTLWGKRMTLAVCKEKPYTVTHLFENWGEEE